MRPTGADAASIELAKHVTAARIAVMVVVGCVAGFVGHSIAPEPPSPVDQAALLGLGAPGAITALLLAVYVTGTEFRERTWTALLVREPRRDRVLIGKASVPTVAVVALTLVVAAAGIGTAAVAGNGPFLAQGAGAKLVLLPVALLAPVLLLVAVGVFATVVTRGAFAGGLVCVLWLIIDVAICLAEWGLSGGGGFAPGLTPFTFTYNLTSLAGHFEGQGSLWIGVPAALHSQALRSPIRAWLYLLVMAGVLSMVTTRLLRRIEV